MREPLLFGTLHWLGHCRAWTGWLVSKAQCSGCTQKMKNACDLSLHPLSKCWVRTNTFSLVSYRQYWNPKLSVYSSPKWTWDKVWNILNRSYSAFSWGLGNERTTPTRVIALAGALQSKNWGTCLKGSAQDGQWMHEKNEKCMRPFSPHIILMPSAYKHIFVRVMSTGLKPQVICLRFPLPPKWTHDKVCNTLSRSCSAFSWGI